RKRTGIFRWRGIIPMVLVVALLCVGWMLFGERIIRDTITEAGTKALGTELDIASVKLHPLSSSVEITAIGLADPFDRHRNLFEVRSVRVQLDGEPLFEKKLVVKTLAITDVVTGTRRTTPAKVVAGPGFTPRALAAVQKFAQQFQVPLL